MRLAKSYQQVHHSEYSIQLLSFQFVNRNAMYNDSLQSKNVLTTCSRSLTRSSVIVVEKHTSDSFAGLSISLPFARGEITSSSFVIYQLGRQRLTYEISKIYFGQFVFEFHFKLLIVRRSIKPTRSDWSSCWSLRVWYNSQWFSKISQTL